MVIKFVFLTFSFIVKKEESYFQLKHISGANQSLPKHVHWLIEL